MKEQEIQLRQLIKSWGLEPRLQHVHEGQRGYTCLFHGIIPDRLIGKFRNVYSHFSCTVGSISKADLEAFASLVVDRSDSNLN